MRGHRNSPFPVNWQILTDLGATRPEVGQACELAVGPFLAAALLAGV